MGITLITAMGRSEFNFDCPDDAHIQTFLKDAVFKRTEAIRAFAAIQDNHSILHDALSGRWSEDAFTFQAVFETLMAAEVNLHLRDWRGCTPLHLVAGSRVPLLLAHGARLDARDHRGNTPLHEAARYWFTGKADALIRCGADLTLRNRSKRTPLEEAHVMNPQESLARSKYGGVEGRNAMVALLQAHECAHALSVMLPTPGAVAPRRQRL